LGSKLTKMRLLSNVIICTILIILSHCCFAQIKKTTTFVYDGNGLEHITLTLRSNGTFKYLQSYDQTFDMGCGKYQSKKDTIILDYKFDENDDCCNTEKREIIWSKGDLIDHRPDSLLLLGSKIYNIVDGRVKLRAKFPLRTNMNKVVMQDNYDLIEKRLAQKATWH
jgi:hypothetical protein